MGTPTTQPHPAPADDENAIRTLYRETLRMWNSRNTDGFAACFTEQGAIVGFDGSVVQGRAEIGRHMGEIFTNHDTPAYVTVIKSVRFLSDDTALLYGIAGMPSLLSATINPALNSIQWMVATRRDGVWRVELFQNTPAQLHGRPDAVAQMTEELQRRMEQTD